MVRRKHVKRIDPRYFLHETVNRNDDGSRLEEGCPHEEEGEAIGISAPGVELHVDDIGDLPPEEAFVAGLEVAKSAIDQLMGGPEDIPPEGDGPLQERQRLNEAEGETPQDVAQRILNLPAMFRESVLGDMRNMAKGDREHHSYYPHVQDHVAFATEVLQLVGEG